MNQRINWHIRLLVPGWLILVLLLVGCKTVKDKPLLERLNELAGVTAVEIVNLSGFIKCFQVDIIQPIDHRHPDGPTFQQRFYLSHRDESGPMVFYTTGYGASRNSEKDITAVINGNQILLVHRYFPDAVPSDNWEYCTTFQAASDQHRIRDIFKQVYSGRWVSSGGSKGGMTALFYRYYYPSDVDATVAYVAPLMNGTDDLRFAAYLEQLGSQGCRDKIKAFQRLILERKREIMPYFDSYIQSRGYEFNQISKEAALEYAVIEFWFAFWQYGTDLDGSTIPGIENENDDQILLNYLLQISPVSYYSDHGLQYYQPLFYQAYTELGYCTYLYSHLTDLLEVLEDPSYRAFAPRGTSLNFNPAVMAGIVDWLKNHGERIIYIYGEYDPWSAGAIIPATHLDAFMLMQPGANHRISILDLDQRERVIDAFNRWLGLELRNASQFRSIAEGPFRF